MFSMDFNNKNISVYLQLRNKGVGRYHSAISSHFLNYSSHSSQSSISDIGVNSLSSLQNASQSKINNLLHPTQLSGISSTALFSISEQGLQLISVIFSHLLPKNFWRKNNYRQYYESSARLLYLSFFP